MKGQWIGKYIGDHKGEIIINIDELSNNYGGVAYLIPEDRKIPTVAGLFNTLDKSNNFTLKTYVIMPINPQTGVAINWKQIRSAYPGYEIPLEAIGNGEFTETKLTLEINTSLKSKFECSLKKKKSNFKSTLKSEAKTWEEYKEIVSKYTENSFIYRGQRKTWRLRTAFHRHGRYDLTRFLTLDIPTLHKNLSAKTKHIFNLEIPSENGAFFNLVQHHGYPTPLLDWTHSPYVAAFFAFHKLPKETTSKDGRVRILIFDKELWENHWKQLQVLNTAGLHLSINEFLAIENDRLVPQQAVTTITNIDDIESYIQNKEKIRKCQYLRAIDIDATERNKVLKELAHMGITAGSLFPGLDGACSELREKHF
ncbi:MAG: FRG domain-containing protein [Candidatus Thiodiazotropha sp. (ex Monitilora ramsayi)]|nr:FRG domain-containing protein [Candidatus Thiodiazotropha sp. (ex Monitilora ramsayi)]